MMYDADVACKNTMNMDATELAQNDEIKTYLKDEHRKANFFSFEQMLNIASSGKKNLLTKYLIGLNSPQLFGNNSNIMNNRGGYDEEEGNMSIFEKLMARPK